VSGNRITASKYFGYSNKNESLLNKNNSIKINNMNTTDFTTTLLVDQTAKQTFKAINDPRKWWSEEIEGDTSKLNDEFSYHFEDIHRCRLKLMELIPDKKVVWQVLDNYFKPGIFADTSQLMSEWDEKRLNTTKENTDSIAHSSHAVELTGGKAEWVGTTIIFEITVKEGKTELRFTHHGLVPEYECFEVCSNGWTHYIRQSLFGLITSGEGQPNKTGAPMTTDEERFHATSK
jgi:hypothetical protein